MPRLQSNVMSACVSPEWLAKTYSEYLYSCAEDQIELEEAIIAQLEDDYDAANIDQMYEDIDINLTVMNDEVTKQGLLAGFTMDEINYRTTSFVQWLHDPSGFNPSEQFENCINNLSSAYRFSDRWATPSDVFDEYADDGIDGDEVIRESSFVTTMATNAGTAVLATLGLPDGYKLATSEGFISLQDLVDRLYINHYVEGAESFALEAFDSLGTSIGEVQLNANLFINELKDNIASSIAWAQGFASSAIPNISDRISNFAENVKTAFSGYYTEAKQCFNNVRAFLSDVNCTVMSFISVAQDAIGVVDFSQIGTTIKETDVYDYTGASPYSGMNFHTAKAVASSVVQVTTVAVAGIWNQIKTLGRKLWGKVRPLVKAITSDPEDIKVCDAGATSYQVDQWRFNGPLAKCRIPFSTEEDCNTCYNLLVDKALHKVISMDSYFSTLTFKLNSLSRVNSPNGLDVIEIEYSFDFKPKLIDTDAAINAGILEVGLSNALFINPTAASDGDTFVSNVNAFINSGRMYIDDDAPEDRKAAALAAGTLCTWAMALAQLYELSDQPANWNGWAGKIVTRHFSSSDITYDVSQSGFVINSYLQYILLGELNPDGNYILPTPTNLTFLRYASGYVASDSYATITPYTSHSDFMMWPDTRNDISEIFSLLMGFFVIQANDRAHNPGNYMFLPFSTDTFDFAPPRYEIKTDAHNRNVAETFIAAITIVVTIAITVLVAKRIARIISRKRYIKLTNKKGQMDAAIWEGQGNTWSRREWRKYLRVDRRLSKMNMWTDGLSAANTVSNLMSGIDSIASSVNSKSPCPTDSSTNSLQRYINGIICGDVR